jgi:cobalt/nickel transport system permease protein
MKSSIPAFLLKAPPPYSSESAGKVSGASFLDKNLADFVSTIRVTGIQWNTARQEGFLQKLDARVKVFSLLFLIIIVSIKKSFLPELGIAGFVLLLAALSRLNLFSFYGRALFMSFIFGFLVALPSCLNGITPGDMVIPLASFSKERCFSLWCIPQTIGVTRQGIEGVSLMSLRVFNSLSLSFLVIYTTPFPEVIRAFKSLKVPDLFLMIITLSYQYIFIFIKIVAELHLARKSKTIVGKSAEVRNWMVEKMAFLFGKTKMRCEEVFNAMLVRGFSGEIKLYAPRKMKRADIAYASLLFCFGVLFLIL